MNKNILVALIILFNINNCLATENQTFEKIFKDKISAASLNIDEGDVEVQSHAESFVKVLYTPHAEVCIVKIDAINNKLNIKNNKKENGCSCDYKIFLPEDVAVNANLGAGTINVNGLKSKMEFNLGAGDVSIFNTTGNINLNMGAGNVKYSPALSSAIQNFEINLGSGELECAYPKDTSVKLPEYSFMAKLISSVKIVDSNYNYEISGSMGSGTVTLTYK
ncbi:MAG: hypothetical protein EKK61_04365 [Rickettsiales bacterium]|nr:MAG: hypothetical protein EKK61_04365 [Rickettsiales bacterium]